MASGPTPAAAPMRALAGLARWTVHWAPVWVPLVFLWQVAVLGWRPALEERARLERERVAVVGRHRQTRERYEGMQAELAAWGDPVYRERLRAILREQR